MPIAAAVLLFIITIYLFMLAPHNKRIERIKAFEKQLIAHRGFFDNAHGIPENSLPAFKRAVLRGFGIELDVQLTKDGRLVVFHDESLERMCGVAKKVHECSFDELRGYRLLNSDERIPSLDEVLEAVNGSVPLIVELKAGGDWRGTSERTAERLDEYGGAYCIESFSPLVVRYFKKHRPGVIRGQLATNYFSGKSKKSPIARFFLTNLLLNFLSRPDFIAFNHRHARLFSYSLLRKLFHVTNVAWTVKSRAELEKAREVFSVIIFDSFDPEE